MKTIEQCKDEALLEIIGITNPQDEEDWIAVIKRAMEIYLESYKQSVREALPSDTSEQISKAMQQMGHESEYLKGCVKGAEWAINQVKELLK